MATTSFSHSHSNEEQQQKEEEGGVKETTATEKERECVHKTKTIQFLGRTTPIVLQNDNGPCPLLAICNVLLLRNNLNLSPDISEVSQEKLLSLVAERLIDSNCNVNNKDAGYVENQQQNIADAIDLLPRLATGIDVNIKFRRIDDFEFTRECAIFDLLDIPLYHGWIVDPQDYETANAIGSKSYNTLMGELVELETRYMEAASKHPDEECVDFAAATAAALGVPSPNLSKTRSFDESPRSLSDQQKETKWDPEEQTKTLEGLDLSSDDSSYQIADQPKARKGDLEEEAQLLEILNLSKAEVQTSVGDSLVSSEREEDISSGSNDGTAKVSNLVEPVCPEKELEEHINNNDHHCAISNENQSQILPETIPAEDLCSSLKNDQNNNHDMSTYTQSAHSAEQVSCTNDVKIDTAGTLVQSEAVPALSSKENAASVSEGLTDVSQGEKVEKVGSHAASGEGVQEAESVHDHTEASSLSVQSPGSDTSSSKVQNLDTHDTFTSSVDGSEPIYEGEECILDSGNTVFEDREPMYEGEVLLAEQADKTVRSKDAISPQQGELIKNFLKNTASQLTFYGLFCLQDGLKERELCVFFRNNHFSTMFKYDGELYLLATDQGYLNQPDLVWEKLNEVNGDTLFMTGNFKEFKVEDQANGTWDEQNAMASTADYLASIDGSQAQLDMNSDFQLAMALQQQEFEQQQQPQSQNGQQPPGTGGSRLITGPQVRRSSPKASSSSRSDPKSKEKCIVM